MHCHWSLWIWIGSKEAYRYKNDPFLAFIAGFMLGIISFMHIIGCKSRIHTCVCFLPKSKLNYYLIPQITLFPTKIRGEQCMNLWLTKFLSMIYWIWQSWPPNCGMNMIKSFLQGTTIFTIQQLLLLGNQFVKPFENDPYELFLWYISHRINLISSQIGRIVHTYIARNPTFKIHNFVKYMSFE